MYGFFNISNRYSGKENISLCSLLLYLFNKKTTNIAEIFSLSEEQLQNVIKFYNIRYQNVKTYPWHMRSYHFCPKKCKKSVYTLQ